MWTLKELMKFIRKSDGAEFSDSAVVVWPVIYPEDLYPPVDPHVTVLYMPDVTTAAYTKEDVIAVIKKTEHNTLPLATVKRLEMFGPLQDTPVLTLENEFLHEYNQALQDEFKLAGITYSDRFPDYKPHVTVSSDAVASGLWPTQFLLAPVELWWQNQKISID